MFGSVSDPERLSTGSDARPTITCPFPFFLAFPAPNGPNNPLLDENKPPRCYIIMVNGQDTKTP